MKRYVVLTTMLTLMSSIVFAHEETRQLNLGAGGIEKLEVNCGVGFLKIMGYQDLKQIEVTAEIKIKRVSEAKAEEIIAKHIKLSLEKKGNRAVLISDYKGPSSFWSIRGAQVQVDLTVRIPRKINLEIEDGSGSVQIDQIMGEVILDDGSGGMAIGDIIGDLDIDDGSGGIDVQGIDGDVSIDDGSGSIDIQAIDGNVVLRDGSGSIHIDGVEKDVTILEEGSGGVSIRNVKGKVSR